MIEKSKRNRKFFVLALLSILLVSVFVSAIVSAEPGALYDPRGTAQEGDMKAPGYITNMGSETSSWCAKDSNGNEYSSTNPPNFFKSRLCLWFFGYNEQTKASLPAIVEIIKWLMLIIVVSLIYSALSFGEFPESTILRIILSVATGFLATFFISTSEILTMMISYTALGVTLSVFLPILILAFFTLAVAKKASPMGIYIQKIVWLIYSVYLFLKTGFGLLISGFGGTDLSLNGAETTFFNIDMTPVIRYFTNDAGQVSNVDPIMLLLLFITSIAIFVIMVLGNKYVTHWFNKEAREAEVEAQTSMLERSHAYDSARSKEIQKDTGKP